MASTDDSTHDDATTPAGAGAPDALAGDPPVAPKRAPRRRATKAVAPGEQAPPAAKKAAKAPKAKKKQPDEAPTTPRRRRATKAAPAAQGAGLEDSPTVDAIVAALTDATIEEAEGITEAAALVDEVPLGVSVALLDAATIDDPITDEDELLPSFDSPAGAPTQAIPSFGLLFQAPEPTVAPRRRRATSPAQAPIVPPASDIADTEDDTSTTADVDGERDDEATAEAESGRARRRRGRGRGRLRVEPSSPSTSPFGSRWRG